MNQISEDLKATLNKLTVLLNSSISSTTNDGNILNAQQCTESIINIISFVSNLSIRAHAVYSATLKREKQSYECLRQMKKIIESQRCKLIANEKKEQVTENIVKVSTGCQTEPYTVNVCSKCKNVAHFAKKSLVEMNDTLQKRDEEIVRLKKQFYKSKLLIAAQEVS